MSAYLEYFRTLERVRSVEPRVVATTVGRHRAEFVRRGWVAEDGYLTRVMVPFHDSEEEVEADIDEGAGVFRYRSPQQRSRIVARPLSEIVLYALRIDTWLNDLCKLISIEPRHLSQQRTRVPDHLWHLGDARIAGTHDFAPVFVGRSWERAPDSEVTSVLCDPAWPRGGVLLRHQPIRDDLPRDHVMRGLNDFVRVEDGQDVFDASAFDRVLRGFVTVSGEPELPQFLQGTRVKLPHFEKSRLVSDTRASILKVMWGEADKTPPAMKWTEVKSKVDCGYRSFDEAFGDKATREEYLILIKAGGHYQVRRQ
ncbi:MAG: hypothetical protein Q8R67_05685 [Rhodoferax sp.]|nr:hypothetical protein [Rhodoferax sp.]MDP3651160.1 hypothetical protein [Rhodoferax sp.]